MLTPAPLIVHTTCRSRSRQSGLINRGELRSQRARSAARRRLCCNAGVRVPRGHRHQQAPIRLTDAGTEINRLDLLARLNSRRGCHADERQARDLLELEQRRRQNDLKRLVLWATPVVEFELGDFEQVGHPVVPGRRVRVRDRRNDGHVARHRRGHRHLAEIVRHSDSLRQRRLQVLLSAALTRHAQRPDRLDRRARLGRIERELAKRPQVEPALFLHLALRRARRDVHAVDHGVRVAVLEGHRRVEVVLVAELLQDASREGLLGDGGLEVVHEVLHAHDAHRDAHHALSVSLVLHLDVPLDAPVLLRFELERAGGDHRHQRATPARRDRSKVHAVLLVVAQLLEHLVELGDAHVDLLTRGRLVEPRIRSGPAPQHSEHERCKLRGLLDLRHVEEGFEPRNLLLARLQARLHDVLERARLHLARLRLTNRSERDLRSGAAHVDGHTLRAAFLRHQHRFGLLWRRCERVFLRPELRRHDRCRRREEGGIHPKKACQKGGYCTICPTPSDSSERPWAAAMRGRSLSAAIFFGRQRKGPKSTKFGVWGEGHQMWRIMCVPKTNDP